MAGPSDHRLYRLGQYASSPGNRAYCYAELTVSFLAVAETIVLIARTHEGMARLSRPGWLGYGLNSKMVYPQTVTHPSTNQARRIEQLC